jgi:hypothetical protein
VDSTGPDHLLPYRHDSFSPYPGKYSLIIPMAGRPNHEELESFAVVNELMELRQKLELLDQPRSSTGRVARYQWR